MKKEIKNSIRSEKGSVILMAVFLAFFITALMVTLEVMRLSDLELVTNQIKDMEAYYCAEAGIEFYLYAIQTNPGFIPSTVVPTLNATTACITGSTRTYRVYYYGAKADPNITFYHNLYFISTGSTKGFSRRVSVSLRRVWSAAPADLSYFEIHRWREL